MTESKRLSLNSNQLKLIALAAMTVDHFTSVIFPDYPTGPLILLLHIIGRIAAPIMWFFIAEGFHYTRNFGKYASRLFLFAIVSHFAYNFAFGIPFIPFQTSVFNQTSVIWALAWGLVALKIDTSENPRLKPWMKTVAISLICIVTFCADWSSIAVLAIVYLGRYRVNFKKQMIGMVSPVVMYTIVYMLFVNPVYGALQMFVILSIPLLRLYNGKRGDWKGMKWLFYLYYPAHLIAAGILRLCLHGNVGVMVGG